MSVVPSEANKTLRYYNYYYNSLFSLKCIFFALQTQKNMLPSAKAKRDERAEAKKR